MKRQEIGKIDKPVSAPETFNEIFAKFDAWYWDKYRHHPEKMVVEQFYKFSNREAV